MPPRSTVTVAVLRVTLGLLMLVWGIDKLHNPSHGMRVSEHFYGNLLTQLRVIQGVGVLQLVLAGFLILGRGLRVAYPALAVVTGTTLLGVWRSVLDPWGWWLGKTNALFFPSLIIFAAVLVVWALERERVGVVNASAAMP
jgi:putative oxidoreductase